MSEFVAHLIDRQWYVDWLPRAAKHWVDALDNAGAKARGDQLVTNLAVETESVVEVIEGLEPTIGLEPMTCRLRTEEDGEPSATQRTSDDVTPPISNGAPEHGGARRPF